MRSVSSLAAALSGLVALASMSAAPAPAAAVAAAEASATAAATAEPAPDFGPLLTVHVDEVRPEMTSEFERLNAIENRGLHDILRRHGQPVRPVWEIATSDGRYLGLRSKKSFTDFDTPSSVPDSVAALFPAVTDSLDGPIHAALRAHYNQVWRFLRRDSYYPERPRYAGTTPGYLQLVSERVIPARSDLYSALVDTLNAALRRTDYPFTVLLFSASYGDGAYHFLWEADSREAFAAAGDRAAVLRAAYGPVVAIQLLEAWQSCLADAVTADATACRAYADLDPALVWPGLPAPPAR